MGKTTQVAFQIDTDTLAQIDRVAAAEGTSRAQAIRTALKESLAHRREREIDEALAAGYAANPPDPDEVGAWSDISVDGLRASDLEW